MGRTKGAKNKPRDEDAAGGVDDKSKKIQKDTKEKLTAEQKKELTAQKKAIQKERNAIEREKKLASMVYNYTPLAETSLGSNNLYNLYGMVIDAQTPHLKPMMNNPSKFKYRQVLRLIDPTMYYKTAASGGNDIHNGCVLVSFFSSKVELLPHFNRVGDIIRIHRANIGQYRQYKTMCVNIDYGSSWALFKNHQIQDEPDQGQSKLFEEQKQVVSDQEEDSNSNEQILHKKHQIWPYKTSKTEFSLNDSDSEKVKMLREWSKEYFANEIIYESNLFMNLNKVKEIINADLTKVHNNLPLSFEREFDLIVKVEDIQENEAEETTIKITDTSNVLLDLNIPTNLMHKNVEVGCVLRVTKVKGATYTRGPGVSSKDEIPQHLLRTLVYTDHSNIMVIDPYFKVHQKFHSKIAHDYQDTVEIIIGAKKQETENQLQTLVAENYFGDSYKDDQINEREFKISRITDKVFDQYQTLTLNEILYQQKEMSLAQEQEQCVSNLFKTRFFVVGFQPFNLLEVCQLFCQNCLETYSFKQFIDIQDKPCCPGCNQESFEPIYSIQFWVKDKSNLFNLNAQKMLLYTCGEVAKEFFNNIQPCNLYLEVNKKYLSQIERFLKSLCKFNTVVDAMVERVELENDETAPFEPVALRIVDCKLFQC